MIRRLMIPVAGTLAALVAIVLAHEPRGAPPVPEIPPFDFPDAPEHAVPDEEEEPQTFHLELQADGTLRDLEGQDTFASVADLAEQLGDAGHALVLSSGTDVTESALDEFIRKVQESRLPNGDPRFHVSKEKLPEPQELQFELEADGSLVVLRKVGDEIERGQALSLAELAKALGGVRHTLVISNGEGVTEAALDAVLAELRDRFQVRKVYRAPETPPAEGR